MSGEATSVINGVLFDLDDTLNDRPMSWVNFAELLTRPPHDCLRPCDAPGVHAAILAADCGGRRPKRQLFEDLRDRLPWRSSPTAEEIEGIWREHFPRCTVLRHGAAEALAVLRRRGIRTAVVTNGRSDAQLAKVDQMGIRTLLDAVITSEAVGASKPDARIFEVALNALDLNAARSVFVGDHPESDVVGPARVGLRTVWLDHGREWPIDFGLPDRRIGTLADLEAVLTTMDPSLAER